MVCILAGFAVGLNALHYVYETIVGYTVLKNDDGENVLPMAMSCIAFTYFLVKYSCIMEDGKWGSGGNCDRICSVPVMLLMALAAGTGLYFVIERMIKEEEYDYNNLETVVPEAAPIVV